MKIGIIGCGVMGSAIARNLVKSYDILLFDHKKNNSEPLAEETGAQLCETLEDLSQKAQMIVLAVKPNHIEELADHLDPLLTKDTLLISILAGVKVKTLKKLFSPISIFRLMPNLPLLCAKGMIGVALDESHTEEIKSEVEKVLQKLGSVTWMKEELMNAYTALTGSNPAFIYLIIESMVEAGISLGLKSSDAEEFVLGTFEGSIELLKNQKKSLQELRWQISSPGGATIAGLHELEAHGVRSGVIAAIKRAFEKASQMDI